MGGMAKRLTKKSFSAEDLRPIGRAPKCEPCQCFMAPLNLPSEPTLCQCPACGAQAHFAYLQ
jgi:hypothetical protein